MATNKPISGFIKLQIPAGGAAPKPPVGPALGQKGVNIKEFCDAFNSKTQSFEAGLVLPVIITVYADRSFSFEIKQPPASVLLRKAAGLEKGSSTPNSVKVGKLTRSDLEDIARIKQVDMTAGSLDSAVSSLAGTARSMGIETEL